MQWYILYKLIYYDIGPVGWEIRFSCKVLVHLCLQQLNLFFLCLFFIYVATKHVYCISVIVILLMNYILLTWNSKWLNFHCFQDESVLIWFSGKQEKHLRLSHVSKIISGQRTVSFWDEIIVVYLAILPRIWLC